MEVNDNVKAAVDKYFGEQPVQELQEDDEMLPASDDSEAYDSPTFWFSKAVLRPENAEFIEKYHQEVLANNLELVQNQEVITLGLISHSLADREVYLVPSYDYESKRLLDIEIEEDSDLLESRIKYWAGSQLITPYSSVSQADDDKEQVYKYLPERTEVPSGWEPVQKFESGGVVQTSQSPESKVANLLGIRSEDIEWADTLGKQYGETEELDGKGDAARHLALGWLANKSKNPKIAKLAIDAREYITTDLNHKARDMDLKNNQSGYQLKAESREQAEQEIQDLIKNKKVHFMSLEESQKVRGYSDGGEVK